MRKIIGMCALALLLSMAVACGSDEGNGDDPAPDVTNTDAFYAAQTLAAANASGTPLGAEPTQPPGADGPSGEETPVSRGTYNAEPPMTIDPSKQYFATIRTEVGDMRLELYPQDAPRHVNNFVFLAREGFYEGVTFHRVIPGFMAQGGDPTGTGSGGPGYTIPDEVNSRQFVAGTLGMAKTSAPNSAGSQWFICFEAASHLNGAYTAFGQLVEGADVLAQIPARDPASATQPGTRILGVDIEEI